MLRQEDLKDEELRNKNKVKCEVDGNGLWKIQRVFKRV